MRLPGFQIVLLAAAWANVQAIQKLTRSLSGGANASDPRVRLMQRIGFSRGSKGLEMPLERTENVEVSGHQGAISSGGVIGPLIAATATPLPSAPADKGASRTATAMIVQSSGNIHHAVQSAPLDVKPSLAAAGSASIMRRAQTPPLPTAPTAALTANPAPAVTADLAAAAPSPAPAPAPVAPIAPAAAAPVAALPAAVLPVPLPVPAPAPADSRGGGLGKIMYLLLAVCVMGVANASCMRWSICPKRSGPLARMAADVDAANDSQVLKSAKSRQSYRKSAILAAALRQESSDSDSVPHDMEGSKSDAKQDKSDRPVSIAGGVDKASSSHRECHDRGSRAMGGSRSMPVSKRAGSGPAVFREVSNDTELPLERQADGGAAKGVSAAGSDGGASEASGMQ